jgi:hypothetical protein
MFEGLDRISNSGDWTTLVFMLVLILITIVNYSHGERFTKLFSLLYSEKYYTDYIKTNPLLFNNFHFFFFFVIIFNISLFLFFIFNAYKLVNVDYNFSFYLILLLSVFLYISLRYLLGMLLGFIFDVYYDQKYFTFLKISNLCLLSVLLFPLLILINYTVGNIHMILVTLGIVIVVILFIIRYYIIVKNEKLNFNNLFYLFLYLCALELSPFIVIYKLFVY